MKHREDELEGVGGLKLYTQSWLPDGRARATVVLAHGAGEHSTRYHDVGERLADSGYAVRTLDHRGHGRSEGERMLVGDVGEFVADLRSLIGDARGQQRNGKVFLLGHSMGGLISLAYACDYQREIDGLLLSAPVAALAAADPVTRRLSKVLGAVAPRLGIYKVDSNEISRDPAVVLDYDTDPLVYHGRYPARTIASLTRTVESFPERVQGLELPLLAMHGSADKIAPPEGSEMVVERAGSADKRRRLYHGLRHEILFEPEGDRVLADAIAWIDERA
jgi:acylglycerol lipase